MRIIFIQLIVPIVCYFIGVFVGKRTNTVKINQIGSDVEIQHVSYTPEQLGYDK